jgi:hypothetical protein
VWTALAVVAIACHLFFSISVPIDGDALSRAIQEVVLWTFLGQHRGTQSSALISVPSMVSCKLAGIRSSTLRRESHLGFGRRAAAAGAGASGGGGAAVVGGDVVVGGLVVGGTVVVGVLSSLSQADVSWSLHTQR